MINYREDAEEWVMTREGEAESFAIGRASASLQHLGTGMMEWRLREDVCGAPLARALMTVCKVIIHLEIKNNKRSIFFFREINSHAILMGNVLPWNNGNG